MKIYKVEKIVSAKNDNNTIGGIISFAEDVDLSDWNSSEILFFQTSNDSNNTYNCKLTNASFVSKEQPNTYSFIADSLEADLDNEKAIEITGTLIPLTEQSSITGSLIPITKQPFEDKYNALKEAAVKLREAQKAYMADRGNDELGKKVGEAATELDGLLGEYD